MAGRSRKKKRRVLKVKRPPGRPPRPIPAGYYSEKNFFDAVRKRFSPKERMIFKHSVERLKTLSTEWRGKDGLYPERAVNAVVNGIKASEINVGYIGQCFGMDRNQYNQFIRYIQRDAAGAAEDSILLAKGYAIACYYRERYEVLDDIPVKKPGVADKGLTFDLFEDLVKIAIWHREELLDKFMTRRKRPKRVSK